MSNFLCSHFRTMSLPLQNVLYPHCLRCETQIHIWILLSFILQNTRSVSPLLLSCTLYLFSMSETYLEQSSQTYYFLTFTFERFCWICALSKIEHTLDCLLLFCVMAPITQFARFVQGQCFQIIAILKKWSIVPQLIFLHSNFTLYKSAIFMILAVFESKFT